jgi:hypothetical protein
MILSMMRKKIKEYLSKGLGEKVIEHFLSMFRSLGSTIALQRQTANSPPQ